MISQMETIQDIGKLSLKDFKTIFESVLAEEGEEAALELLKARCATDLELFASTFFPHYAKRPFNQFHRDLFSSYQYGQRNVREADAAPRGSAKSTFRTIIQPIHDVCYGLERFIVVISNTQPLAALKLKDIRNEVLNNVPLAAAYGVRFPTKNPGATEFTIISDAGETHFMAFGKGGEVRGARYHEHRPTKIILDDVEKSKEVHSESLREKTLEWFNEDVSKLGDEGTSIVVVGTILHKDSLLANVIKNPAYKGRIYRSIVSWSEREDLWQTWREIYTNLDDPDRLKKAQAFYEANEKEMLKGTKVLWPEKESYLDLMKEMVEIGKAAFFKEKQNEPLGADDLVFETFHWYREVYDEKLGRCFLIESTNTLVPFSRLRHHCYGVIDPSVGKTKAKDGKLGDFSCLLTGFKDPQTGRLFVHHDWTKRRPPSEYINRIFTQHEEFQYQKFGVETNLYRELLLPVLVQERKRLEKERGDTIQLAFYEIEQTENKTERIFAIEPKVTHGWIVLNRALSETFKTQLEDFPHADHDDGPDALEMLWSLVNNRYKASAVSISAMSGR